MDLGAYCQIDDLESYVARHYGVPPRLRGIRLMKMERPVDPHGFWGLCSSESLFNEHVGEDVVYIHTRCGAYGQEVDPDYNYVGCGGRDWERSNPDTFIESCDDGFDPTYRDHYFKAVVDDEYLRLVEALSESGQEC